jgi:FlaA1/EpsC-like NDP-sugar epimerase
MHPWLVFALQAIEPTHGGEVFIPKCDAWNLLDLANAFQLVVRDKSILVAPPRYGDKTHETLVSEEEAQNTLDLGWAYVIQPSDDVRNVWNYVPHEGKQLMNAVTSDAVRRMGIDELRTLITRTV